MKKPLVPHYALAESPDALSALLEARKPQSVRIVTEPAVWEAGLLTGPVSMLDAASIPRDVRFAADILGLADLPPADMYIAAGGHGALACLPPKGRAVYLPVVTADESDCLHLLAHGVEAALAPCLRPSDRADAAEACADIIRALRNAPEDGLDDAGYLDVAAAALRLAKVKRTFRGNAHLLATTLGTTRAQDVSPYEALHGAAHETATLLALPAVLAWYGDKARRQLAFIAQLAGLASKGAGDDVASAALMTWLKEQNAALHLPERYTHIPRRDVYPLALAVEEAAKAHPRCLLTPDRFTAEDLLLKLIQPEAPTQDAQELVALQRDWFRRNGTLPLSVRRDALKRLQRTIRAREHDIHAALRADLGKCPDEAYLCETGMVLAELGHMLAHLKRYARRTYVPTPLHQFPALSFTQKRPYGVTLVMSPWNYPFLLTMDPLIGALAAGNTCVVKPSAYAPHTSRIIREIVEGCFPQEHAAVIEGGREQNQALLDQHFDKIFFTGGATVGRLVLQKAAENLTPVTLELGGKSPVVVDETADIPLAARRIAFGKLLNAGQTCVAPDYILVHQRVKDALINALKAEFIRMAGENPLENDAFPHLINQKHYERVMGLIDQARVVHGGRGDLQTLRIQPTILDGVTGQDAVMQEEIFGPVLPVIGVESLEEAIAFIRERPTPLACYLFTKDGGVKRRFLRETPFGGGCVNDTIIHLASSRLPFGGMGESGMGMYHGRHSFDCFSHTAGVVDKSTLIDLPMRYAPYTEKNMKLIRFFLK